MGPDAQVSCSAKMGMEVELGEARDGTAAFGDRKGAVRSDGYAGVESEDPLLGSEG